MHTDLQHDFWELLKRVHILHVHGIVYIKLFIISVIFFLYTPVCIMGYITYGNSLRSSIINSLQITGIQQAVNIFITVHCILTLTIVFNPLNQDIEELFRIPQRTYLLRFYPKNEKCLSTTVVSPLQWLIKISLIMQEQIFSPP